MEGRDSGLGRRWKGTVRKNWVGAGSATLADCTMCAPVGGRVVSLFPSPRRASLSSKNSRSFARARAARSLRMTSAASPRERKKWRIREWEGRFPLPPSEASELVILSAAGADDLRCGVEEQQVLRSRASRALAQDDNAASPRERKKWRIREWEGRFPLPPSETSELVILSAAGAKDLLVHRCEGRFRPLQPRSICFSQWLRRDAAREQAATTPQLALSPCVSAAFHGARRLHGG